MMFVSISISIQHSVCACCWTVVRIKQMAASKNDYSPPCIDSSPGHQNVSSYKPWWSGMNGTGTFAMVCLVEMSRPWSLSASLSLQILTEDGWQGWKQKPLSLQQPLLLSLCLSWPYKKSRISVKVCWRCKLQMQMSEECLESWNKIPHIHTPIWFQCTSLICYLWHKTEELSGETWGSNLRLYSDFRVITHLLLSLR